MTPVLEILFEDEDLVAVNKPSGLLTEGGESRERDLEQLVTDQVGRKALCCHRLDRLTSGVVLLRKNARFRASLAEVFEKRRARKEYWVLVDGVWDKRVQRVETQIASLGNGVWANVDSGGKAAVSTFQSLGIDPERRVSWLRALLKTGRTHQLRLHCKKAGCPILGDPLYGLALDDGFFGLHARSLSMKHPGTGAALEVQAAPPESWQAVLERFAT